MNLEEKLDDIRANVAQTLEHQKKQSERIERFESRVKLLEEKVTQPRFGAEASSVNVGNDGNKEQFSLSRAIMAITQKNAKIAPREWEIMKKAYHDRQAILGERRDLSTDVDSAGGFIVPEQYIPDLIQLFRAKTVVREMGATVLDGLTGSPVKIPKQTGGATAFWVGENNDITESQQTVDMVEARPREAAAMTVMSNQLLRLSNPSVEAMVRADIVAVLARLTDLAALRGTGASNQPLGIVNTPGVSTVAIGGAPSVDDLYDMIFELENSDADLDDAVMGWVMPPRTWNTLRKLKDGNGNFILTTSPTPGNVVGTSRPARSGMLLGHPFRTTTQMPTNLGAGAESEIIFGNWKDLVIAEWGGMEIMASQETSDAFQKNQTWIRILMLMDTLIRHPESFVIGTGVTV